MNKAKVSWDKDLILNYDNEKISIDFKMIKELMQK